MIGKRSSSFYQNSTTDTLLPTHLVLIQAPSKPTQPLITSSVICGQLRIIIDQPNSISYASRHHTALSRTDPTPTSGSKVRHQDSVIRGVVTSTLKPTRRSPVPLELDRASANPGSRHLPALQSMEWSNGSAPRRGLALSNSPMGLATPSCMAASSLRGGSVLSNPVKLSKFDLAPATKGRT